jgi:hypothetical protein
MISFKILMQSPTGETGKSQGTAVTHPGTRLRFFEVLPLQGSTQMQVRLSSVGMSLGRSHFRKLKRR